MKFEIVTKYNEEEIRHDIMGDVVQLAMTQIMLLKDKHTRRALKELGWVPPEETVSQAFRDDVKVLLDLINEGDVIIMRSTTLKQDVFETALRKVTEYFK